MTLAKARIINYDRNSSFIVLATVIMIVNYNPKTFIVQATVTEMDSISDLQCEDIGWRHDIQYDDTLLNEMSLSIICDHTSKYSSFCECNCTE